MSCTWGALLLLSLLLPTRSRVLRNMRPRGSYKMKSLRDLPAGGGALEELLSNRDVLRAVKQQRSLVRCSGSTV